MKRTLILLGALSVGFTGGKVLFELNVYFKQILKPY